MTGKSQATLIAEIRDLIGQINRKVEDLESTVDQTTFQFNDRAHKVFWNYGVISFRSDGFVLYDALQCLYYARPEAISHAEFAEVVYGDDLADIDHCVRSLQNKLEDGRCPLRVAWNKEYIWLKDA